MSKNRSKIFVVQKHFATHLHYDFRLEIDGVLKSFAIPKTPPLEVGIKRLAIQTDDHLLEYASFEGVIPKGQYGAGKVEIWDRGKFEFLEKMEDKMVFILDGEKLKRRYVLIRLKDGRNWLFFKGKEE
ncbi:MAG: DNA polymerase ligase N-terminal domain-containing protein [Candidatus Methanofastidiosia archaeon]